MEGKAVNVIKFNVRGLNLLNGQLTIEASFKPASKSVKFFLLKYFFSFFLHLITLIINKQSTNYSTESGHKLREINYHSGAGTPQILNQV